jgi:hypothetical protein
MRHTLSWSRRTKGSEGGSDRSSTRVGTRGDRSHAGRPVPQHAHELPRLQPPGLF